MSGYRTIASLVALSVVSIAGILFFNRGAEVGAGKSTVPELSQTEKQSPQGYENSHESSAPAADIPQATQSGIRVPFNFVFAGNDRIPLASSWEELVAGYSDSERSIIDEFVLNFAASAYLFNSLEELEWMVSRGFPMPEDILAASRMNESELLGLALSGNTKAAFFHLDRLYSSNPISPRGFDSTEQKWRIKSAALKGESPFIGYLEAARLNREYPESPTAASGALAWAMMRGDTRAGAELRRPGIDPQSMLSWAMLLQGEEDQLRQLGYLHGSRSLSLSLRIPTPGTSPSVPIANRADP